MDSMQEPLKKGDKILNGKFEIINDTVNKGGFGRIYRALSTDPIKRRKVKYAVKEFFVGYINEELNNSSNGIFTINDLKDIDGRWREMFSQEAAILRLIRKGNHVPKIIHEPCNDGNRLLYVMEYIEGPTVGEEIDNWGPMDEGRVVEIATQVGSVLVQAHRCGIAHSDISPNNIILRNANSAVLVDFGNARSYDYEVTLRSSEDSGMNAESHICNPNTNVSNSAGTPHFIAPYEYRGTQQGDVYSLAATLYFMLTGCYVSSYDRDCKCAKEKLENSGISDNTVNAIVEALLCKTDSVEKLLEGLALAYMRNMLRVD